jgi:hypothetical protein
LSKEFTIGECSDTTAAKAREPLPFAVDAAHATTGMSINGAATAIIRYIGPPTTDAQSAFVAFYDR